MEEIHISCLYPFCLLHLRLSISLPPNLVTYAISVPFAVFMFHKIPFSHRLSLSVSLSIFSYLFSQMSLSTPLPMSQMSRPSYASPWPRFVGSMWHQSPSGTAFSKVASHETMQTSMQRSWNSNHSFQTRIRLHFTLPKPFSSSPHVSIFEYPPKSLFTIIEHDFSAVPWDDESPTYRCKMAITERASSRGVDFS